VRLWPVRASRTSFSKLLLDIGPGDPQDRLICPVASNRGNETTHGKLLQNTIRMARHALAVFNKNIIALALTRPARGISPFPAGTCRF